MQYLERMPDGIIPDKTGLLREAKEEFASLPPAPAPEDTEDIPSQVPGAEIPAVEEIPVEVMDV